MGISDAEATASRPGGRSYRYKRRGGLTPSLWERRPRRESAFRMPRQPLRGRVAAPTGMNDRGPASVLVGAVTPPRMGISDAEATASRPGGRSYGTGHTPGSLPLIHAASHSGYSPMLWTKPARRGFATTYLATARRSSASRIARSWNPGYQRRLKPMALADIDFTVPTTPGRVCLAPRINSQ